MQLDIVYIYDKNMYWDKINKLAEEAFPPDEYLSPNELLDMAKSDNFDFLLLLDKNEFIGFVVTQIYKNMVYLFFLAIDEKYRSKGYGSYAIKALIKTYPNKQQVVDLEMVDENADNFEQRLKRKNFYLKNGYKETNLFLSYLGVDYEVLCMDDDFNADEFKQLMASIKLTNFFPKYFIK